MGKKLAVTGNRPQNFECINGLRKLGRYKLL